MSALFPFPEAASQTLSPETIEVLETRAVAPLVACAQGLFEIDPSTPKQTALKLAFPDPTNGRTSPARALTQSTTEGGIGMPWFTPRTILDYLDARENNDSQAPLIKPETSFGQWRPHRPVGDMKYQMAKGVKLALGVHPSTPKEWFNNPAQILFAEGLFKGLSALSAHLKECGIPVSSLTQFLPENEARETLHSIMGSLDYEHRILFVSFVSVTTWRGRPEWNDLPVRGKTAYVAFDADVASNPNVYREASQLWEEFARRKATPFLLTPFVPGEDKAGIDDYLATGSTLESLLSQARADLPVPPGPAVYEGQLRVDDERACVEKAALENGLVRWDLVTPLGGRIVSIDTRRAPTPEERESGTIMKVRQDSLESQEVEIEVTWIPNGSREVQREIISGPIRILSEDPRSWSRIHDVLIPPEIQVLPQWPPAPQWLQAIKDNHRDERQDTNTWMTMGWVPTATTPVFIAGRDVMGPSGLVHDVRPGVTSGDQLNAATDYGMELADDREAVRDELARILDLYTDDVWQSPGIAGIVLASALRPIVPIRPITTIALAGPPNAGKSWTISRAMSFWQARPEAFARQLPGSAEDSIASTEQSLSRSFLWVLDDAAAQATRARAEAITENVNQAIRAVFNGTGRGRSTNDGQQRIRSNPQAVLFVSAENFTGVESIQQRTVLISVARGEFLSTSRDKTSAVVAMERETMWANHVASESVRLVARQAAEMGWSKVRGLWRHRLKENHLGAEASIRRYSPQTDRGADTAADLILGLDLLADLAEYVGLDVAHQDIIQDLKANVFDHIAVMWRDQGELSGGRRLIRALSNGLAAGDFSVMAAGRSSAPFSELIDTNNPWRTKLSEIHQRLGWQPASANIPAAPRARDKVVGVAVMAKGEPCVLFNSENAFRFAARNFPELVSPGQRSSETWSQVWSEGIPSTEWKRRSNSKGRPRVQVRIMVDGVQYDGVPIPLTELFEWDRETLSTTNPSTPH